MEVACQIIGSLAALAYVAVLFLLSAQAIRNRNGWAVLRILLLLAFNFLLALVMADTLLAGAMAHCGEYGEALVAGLLLFGLTLLLMLSAENLGDQLRIAGRQRWLARLINLPVYLYWIVAVILWTTCTPRAAG